MITDRKLSTERLNLYFSEKHVLKDINIGIPQNKITALIGPSGCGKTSLIRTFNRMHDLLDYAKITGKIMIDDTNIYDPKVSATQIRKRIGMVFQKANPFPKNIYDNIAYGLKINNTDPRRIPELVEQSLRESFLWDEVKDELKKPAFQLSVGQQQRLCIARAVSLRPEVILMDEPCSALDPFSSLKIEELILELRKSYTVVIVTHNMQQAQRLSDYTVFMYLGQLIEFGITKDIFNNPQHDLTKNYITGHFG